MRMPTTERYAANPRDGSDRRGWRPRRAMAWCCAIPRCSTPARARTRARGPSWSRPMDVRRALFLPREHLEITRDPTFRNNILYWLLEEPRGGVRTAGTTAPAPPRR